MKTESPSRPRASVLALGAVLALALAGCGQQIELKRPRGETNRVSPPLPEIAKLPPGTFNQARAKGELDQARAAGQAGDTAGARKLAEASLTDWPGDPAAWEELAALCRVLKDTACASYADFFGAKVDFVNGQPPRVGTLGFATLGQQDVGSHVGEYTYDQRTIDMARRLASFYDARDAITPIRPVPPPPKTP